MKKPTGNIWWVPGGDTRSERQEGFGHCQSLPPPLHEGKEAIEFIPKSVHDALIKKLTNNPSQ